LTKISYAGRKRKSSKLSISSQGTAALLGLCIQAWKPLRFMLYEIFKLLHIGLAALSMAALWYHLKLEELPQLKYVFAIILIWVGDHIARSLRLVYLNIGISGEGTVVEALPGDACRVLISMPRTWYPQPGQYAYLYMPGIGLWQSHPFSITWADERNDLLPNKLFSDVQHSAALRKPQISFIIRARTGMTRSLYRKALTTPRGTMKITCFVEGPYGVKHSLGSYGTVMLFAGGVGITHQLPYVKSLVTASSKGIIATRRVLLIWSIQYIEHIEWALPWLKQVQAIDVHNEVLQVMVFVSRLQSIDMVPSPLFHGSVYGNRPDIDMLVAREQEGQIGAMAVSVCGPGELSDEVRGVVRGRQSSSNVDFIEETSSL
jgi:predicted ferric reductase